MGTGRRGRAAGKKNSVSAEQEDAVGLQAIQQNRPCARPQTRIRERFIKRY